MIQIVRVDGNSMAPTLGDGDYCVGMRVEFCRAFSVGQVVIAVHPRYGKIIKRIKMISSDGTLSLSGDGAASVEDAELSGLDPLVVEARVFWVVGRRGSRCL